MISRHLLASFAFAAAAVTLVEASLPGVSSNPLSAALRRLSGERTRLQQLTAETAQRPDSRSIWYLGKLESGLDGARDIIRSMIGSVAIDENGGTQLPATAHMLSITDVLRHEGAQGEACSIPGRKGGRLAGRRIVLDAGHGGKDEGATGRYRRNGAEVFSLREKDLTLDVSLKLARRLREEGAEVYLTRAGDDTLDLYGRGIAGRALDADLFMSVHFNYSPLADPTKLGGRPVDGVNYTHIYVHSPTRRNMPMPGYSEQVADRLQAGQPGASNRLAGVLFDRLSASLGTSDTPPEHVRKAMRAEEARRARLASSRRKSAPKKPAAPPKKGLVSYESITAAQLAIHNAFYSRYPEASLPKGVRRADFVVLREVTNKPAVLVETSFIGDRTELLALKGEARRKTIVDSLYQGICDYYGL